MDSLPGEIIAMIHNHVCDAAHPSNDPLSTRKNKSNRQRRSDIIKNNHMTKGR